MGKSKTQITLWILGHLSGLLLLFYLPVLIWSPPWGENGYYYEGINGKLDTDSFNEVYKYTGDKIEPYYSFTNGYLQAHSPQWDTDIHRSIKFDAEYKLIKKNIWVNRHQGIECNLRFEANTFICEQPDLNYFICIEKTTNPLNIWYIKYLEWIN